MDCSKCGHENEDYAVYCSNCGELLGELEEDEFEDEETQNKGINGSRLLKVIVVFLILITIRFVYLCIEENVDNRKEIYTFYITNEDEDILMQGGLERQSWRNYQMVKPIRSDMLE